MTRSRLSCSQRELPGRLAGAAGARRGRAGSRTRRCTHREAWTGRSGYSAEEHGIPAHTRGDATIVIDEPLGGLPESTLILALRLADETGPVFAQGATEDGRRVLAAWCAPWLAVEKVGKTGLPYGGAWKVGAGQTLYVIDRADMPRADLRWPAGSARPLEIADLLSLADDDDKG